MTNTPVEYLTCCCCGSTTKGRQWWNRDTGYGLCNDCIQMNGVSRVKVGEEASSFGIRGTHWDIRNTGGHEERQYEPTIQARVESPGIQGSTVSASKQRLS